MESAPEIQKPMANTHKWGTLSGWLSFRTTSGATLLLSTSTRRGTNDDDDDNDVEKALLGGNTMRFRKRSAVFACLRVNAGYIFLFFVFVAFMKAGFYAANLSFPDTIHVSESSDSSWHTGDDAESIIAEHPIPRLMEEAEEAYRRKLKAQSSSLSAAVSEYKRRYGRPPPKGFDEWWKFAQKNEVKMVDEYDGLMSDLEPFWELSGEELRRRAVQASQLVSIDLVRVKDGKATTVSMHPGFKDSEVSARAHGFRTMIEKFTESLPDMDFPINAKAEGRVLVPWEHRIRPNLTQQDSSGGIESVLGGPFRPDWGDSGNVWEAWRRTCKPSSAARQLYSSLRNPFSGSSHNYLLSHSTHGGAAATADPTSSGSDFNFAVNTSFSIDFCNNPYEHYTQGHFFSDWRSIPALYPVFSPAKARGFLDIRIPSHYYFGSTKRYTYGWDAVNLELKAVDPMEVPWEDKEDKVFWRGATTGGGNHPPGFQPQFQRHRFLRMTSDKSDANRTIIYASNPVPLEGDIASTNSPPHYAAAALPVTVLNDAIMDTAFVKAVSGDSYPGGMQALMNDHRFGDSVPLGRHWAYKYLVDLDGMSYSGRFMAFLASDSVPIKATVYDEYFSDWIQPWVHFIPLSASYKEIYNIVSYFSGPPEETWIAKNATDILQLRPKERRPIEGDVRLRRIARAGKQWKQTIGRKVDMEVYVYRLALEWARLWADDREAMTYS